MEKKVLTTTDYSKFKRLEGNRPIRDKRVDKIVQSILNIGYITSPILVNENMEVIDGQGRLSALERLNMPVEYIVHDGIGIEECRQMNIHQSNWTDYDYVCSYAIRGSEDYARLQSLMDAYDLPNGVAVIATTNYVTYGGSQSKKLRSGSLKVSKEDYERAKWELSYAINFKQVARSVGGRSLQFYHAVVYAYRNLTIEQRNRLEEVVRQHMLEIPSLRKPGDFLKYFDEFYNKGLTKAKRIHLALQWATDNI